MRSVEVWRTNGAFAVSEIGHSMLCEDCFVGPPKTSHKRTVESTVPADGTGYAMGASAVASTVPQRTVWSSGSSSAPWAAAHTAPSLLNVMHTGCVKAIGYNRRIPAITFADVHR